MKGGLGQRAVNDQHAAPRVGDSIVLRNLREKLQQLQRVREELEHDLESADGTPKPR